MKMPKKVTNEELARMIAERFENTATKSGLAKVQHEIENLSLKFDNVAYKFEVKDLDRRVTKLEQKFSTD